MCGWYSSSFHRDTAPHSEWDNTSSITTSTCYVNDPTFDLYNDLAYITCVHVFTFFNYRDYRQENIWETSAQLSVSNEPQLSIDNYTHLILKHNMLASHKQGNLVHNIRVEFVEPLYVYNMISCYGFKLLFLHIYTQQTRRWCSRLMCVYKVSKHKTSRANTYQTDHRTHSKTACLCNK